MKTTLSDDIMNEIANLIEKELNNRGIFYFRNGTKFNVKQDDINNLLEAQMNATKKLISDGVITMDMIIDDVKTNFPDK